MNYARSVYRGHYCLIIAPSASGLLDIPSSDFEISNFGPLSAFMATLDYVSRDFADNTIRAQGQDNLSGVVNAAGDIVNSAGTIVWETLAGVGPLTANWQGGGALGVNDRISIAINNGSASEKIIFIDYSIAVCPGGDFVNANITGGG